VNFENITTVAKPFIGTTGTISASGSAVQVSGATTVDIFFDAETSYRYSSSNAYTQEMNNKLNAAVSKGYTAVSASAVSDHASLMNRIDLNLGQSSNGQASKSTDARWSAWKSNSNNGDIEFAALYFNYGRHLMVAGSRKTGNISLPTNLQGIWNGDYNPAWGSKYTININLEMNYWGAESTALADSHEALYDIIDIARVRGQAVAKKLYQCPGFVLHHNIDVWGDAAPVDNGTPYSVWPMGGIWLSMHLMEHYRYSGDKDFLANRAWPVLKDAATFYYCYLFSIDGYMQTGPSLSPELVFTVPSPYKTAGHQDGVDVGTGMDNELLYDLFTSMIEACEALGTQNTSDCQTAQQWLPKIRPPQIGPDGRILEWRTDRKEQEPGHRHMSPIYGLYPGSQLTPRKNQTLATAAKAFLTKRMSNGSGSTGWSRAWVSALYARLYDGSSAWSSIQYLITKYTLANLFNSDSGPGSAFQIDGNFGLVGALPELLMQSHAGVVHILPALPSAWGTGSVRGLRARGGFEVDVYWSGGKLQQARVISHLGNQLSLALASNAAFSVNNTKYTAPISTTVGTYYIVLPV
jgi:hypothetical protein